MPGLTGAERALAVKEVKAGLPIILCTSHSDLISKEKAFEEIYSQLLPTTPRVV